MANIKDFEEKQKVTLMDTIGSKVSVGLDDLGRTIGFAKKKPGTKADPNQITIGLDKYENRLIEKRKP